MKIEVLEKSDRKLEFILRDANPAVANALRRAMMNEVPTMAIEIVKIHKNSSGLFNEILAHRLGLIPLKFPVKLYNLKSECKCGGKGCSRCQVKVKFDSKKKKPDKEGKIIVYAGDLEFDDKEVKPVDPNIPIVILLEGQELKFEAIAQLGIGKEHAKWQAAVVGYSYLPEVRVSGDKCNGCGACVAACPKGVFVKKDGKVRVKDSSACSLCMRCVEVCEQGAISVKGDETAFRFKVESVCGLTAKEILERALDIIEKKVKMFKKDLKL